MTETTKTCCKEAPGGCRAALCSGLHVMGVTRDLLGKALADFSGDALVAQPFPGANHALFIMGHLAVSDAFFLRTIGGTPTAVPEGWDELFGMGAEPKADIAAYPPEEEVRQAFTKAREELIEHFRSLDEDTLASTVNEPLNDVADCVAGLTSFIAMHDGMHTGQTLNLRKALGMPYLFG
ncbi:MAG: DinB family protein [Planctomycetota bacterium]|nr:MAG: DinB family protein [Planctomycetota bacterium]